MPNLNKAHININVQRDVATTSCCRVGTTSKDLQKKVLMLTLQKNHFLAEIEDEKDENVNDNVAPIFQKNKVKTTTESTKILISEKKPRTDVRKVFHLSIANEKPNTLGLTSTILKTDVSVKRAKSIQTL